MDTERSLRAARAALTWICEPGDTAAMSVVAACGPVEAVRLARSLTVGPETVRAALAALEAAGYADPRKTLESARERWGTRGATLAPELLLERARAVDADLLIPESPSWPSGLESLGLSQPFALWVRGDGGEPPLERLSRLGRSIAVVGSREATRYGLGVADRIADAAIREGVTVISGGAFGIDYQAHTSALSTAVVADPSLIPTVAISAGGVDRFYPDAHSRLYERILAKGLVLAEAPPGGSPTRWRFLQRNRLIAALSQATVVVEARARSGALSTANHALGIGRPVGAVPGNIDSPSSAGCNRLIQESGATLVGQPGDALSLLPGWAVNWGDTAHSTMTADQRVTDSLGERECAVFEATPVRQAAEAESIARVAGVPLRETVTVLARLEMKGLVHRENGRWVRQKPSRASGRTG